MSFPAAARAALMDLGVTAPWVTTTLAGGSINQVVLIESQNRARAVLKLNPAAPPDLFAREAEGLRLVRSAPDGPRTPEPLAWGPDFLILEHLAPEPRAATAAADLGVALARLHACVGQTFGGVPDNYLGSTPQPNPATEDGHRFFVEQRLGVQLRRARDAGLLTERDVRAGEGLCRRLRALVPVQPPSIVHGDLWSGNVIAGPGGALCIIDPAAYYGWAEADLALTTLFGSLPEAFYAAYQSVRPLASGWRDRFAIYNLHHLLNHLNLFGLGYRADVRACLDRFA